MSNMLILRRRIIDKFNDIIKKKNEFLSTRQTNSNKLTSNSVTLIQASNYN